MLLEILIALTLVMLALVPIVRQPLQFQIAEKKQMLRIEADRIAAWTYSEIREKFLKGGFRWEQIPILHGESKAVELSTIPLRLPPVANDTIERSFTMETIGEKEHEGKISRLVSIHLKLKSKQMKTMDATYRLIVEKQTEIIK